MQLTFESLAELQDFVQWVQTERSSGLIVEAAPKATIIVQDLPVGDGVAVDEVEQEAEQVADEAPAAKTVTVRKRRTKAEMEAARAAETANPTAAVGAEVETGQAVVSEESAPTATAAEPSSSAPIDKGDAVEFIKSRLAERPEVSQVEHLNLARTFIGKHGMEKYNASFPLAGLTPNVMGYSPADCATHAAALDYLSLE